MTYREIADDQAAVIGQGWENLEELYLWPSDLSYISAGMKSSIQAGLGNGNEEVLNLPATCPSGNCKFNDYSALAVCVSFADVTEHLYATNNTVDETTGLYQVRLQLTNDHYLVRNSGDDDLHHMPRGEINVSSVATSFEARVRGTGFAFLSLNQSIAFRDLQAPLADIFIITRNGSITGSSEKMTDDLKAGYAAFEIALSWCVQSFATEVVNATSTTRRLSTNHNFTWYGGRHAFVNDAPHSNNSTRDWNVDGRHHASLQWHLKQLLSGEQTEVNEIHSATSDVVQILYDPFEDLSDATGKGNLSERLHQTEREGLRLIFDNVATSMTNRVRRMMTPLFGVANTKTDPNLVYKADGDVFAQVTVVHIRWPWITAHVCFTLFSIGFLGATILSHRASPLRGIEPWKSSGTAILHALEPGLQKQMGGVEKVSAAQQRGLGRLVRLKQVRGGRWMLVEAPTEDEKDVGR
jgi:hypothetical protein